MENKQTNHVLISAEEARNMGRRVWLDIDTVMSSIKRQAEAGYDFTIWDTKRYSIPIHLKDKLTELGYKVTEDRDWLKSIRITW